MLTASSGRRRFSTRSSSTGCLLGAWTGQPMRGDATAISRVAPSGISLVWSYRSVSTAPRRQRGPTRLPGRYPSSSSIFAKSEAFAQALSTITGTTCAGSNAISIRWAAATSACWHCPWTAQEFGSRAMVCLASTLRVFLGYANREGVLRRDLSKLIEVPQHYRLADIPRSIGWDSVQKMLDQVDRRTAVGRRDYTMLLLMVTYGLRAREVAALTLDDIDWKRDRLHVRERKADHTTAYPLAPVIGEAIIDYMKNGRPNVQSRGLFWRHLAPRSPLTHGAVSTIASKYLHRAGVPVSRPGSHTLRHACVQRLVDSGFPLKTVGDYVGHRSPSSTMIYAKVQVDALREVALGDGRSCNEAPASGSVEPDRTTYRRFYRPQACPEPPVRCRGQGAADV